MEKANALISLRRSLLQGACGLSRKALFTRRSFSSLDDIEPELTSRKLPILVDRLTQTNSRLLDATLADFLPPSPIAFDTKVTTGKGSSWREMAFMRPGHHLVYFPPVDRLSELLPDGTDPNQSPGEPFVRRMWAGGQLTFRPSAESTHRLTLSGKYASVCVEKISEVFIRGAPGDERIFVTIQRFISGAAIFKQQHPRYGTTLDINFDNSIAREEEYLRVVLPTDSRTPAIEQRMLVFMRQRAPGAALDTPITRDRIVKSQFEPTRTHTLIPTPALLFRFSALTFNAHRIHLGKAYCREIEGHRNLLVHGPLSLVLMLEFLNRYLAEQDAGTLLNRFVIPGREILEISYRNMAPLYAEEEMKLCLRDRGDGEFDLWVEDRDGGLAVRATAKTAPVDIELKNRDSSPKYFRPTYRSFEFQQDEDVE